MPFRWPVVVGLLLLGSTATANLVPLGVPLQGSGYVRELRWRGVSVYRHERARVVRLAAEGRIQAAPAAVRAALLAYNRHAGAVARVAESRILTRGPGWLRVYQRLAPPIISDRDFTLLVRWGSRGKLDWIHWQVDRGEGPAPREGIVRVPVNQGTWQLYSVDGGRATHARYILRLDLAGSLPRFLARSGAGKEVVALFGAICRLAGGRQCIR